MQPKDTMSIFTKDGTELKHLVTVPPSPTVEPIYNYQFPKPQANGTVKMLWARAVRPIQDMTRMLRGLNVRRYRDYAIEFAGGNYQYWFKDAQVATMFALFVANQTHPGTGPKGYAALKCVCPQCNHAFKPKDWCV